MAPIITQISHEREMKGAFHLVTQVSFYLCYLLNAKKDRTMFVSTCVTKWKAPLDLLYYWLLQVKTENVVYLTLQGRVLYRLTSASVCAKRKLCTDIFGR